MALGDEVIGAGPIGDATGAFYITDLVDTGTPWRFKPRGWDQSSHWSILKLDKVKVLMWSSDPISITGVNKIGEFSGEGISQVAASGLSALRNDAYPIATTLGETLFNLLMVPPDARWPALRSMRDGVFRVKMGNQLVWSVPDPLGPRGASKQAQDNFNRADANLDGSTSSDGQFTWTETAGTGWTVASNQATSSVVGAVLTSAQAVFDLDTDDMDVLVDVITNTSTGGADFTSPGVFARGNGASFGGAGAGFAASLRNTNEVFTGQLYDLTDNVELSIASMAGGTGAVKFTVDGSNLEMFRNGVSVTTATDTSHVGVVRGGMHSYIDATTGTVTVDNFLIQDVGFGGERPLIPSRMDGVGSGNRFLGNLVH